MILKKLIIVAILLSLIGCRGGSSSSATVSAASSSANYALAESTAFTEGSSSSQNSIKSETQWTNVDYSESDSNVHPYEQMNVHKAQSFSDGTNNLTGVGQFIHIADFNCDDDHKVYLNKTIHNLDDGGSGESTFGAANSSSYHCQAVASMAAGDGTGDGDTSGQNLINGVAPDADLILSSIPNTSGSYKTDDFAADLDLARGYAAVASNNSWGMGDDTDSNANATWNITELKNYISNNNLTINATNNFISDSMLVWISDSNISTPEKSDLILGPYKIHPITVPFDEKLEIKFNYQYDEGIGIYYYEPKKEKWVYMDTYYNNNTYSTSILSNEKILLPSQVPPFKNN